MIVTEKAPAKLNLSLDTPMRYFDGSPKWDMVMVSADLADYVTVETHRRPATIKVYTNSGFLPNDQRNLAYQAAHILRNRFHCKDGVTIRIKKQIPVAAGLGGGSSDAAAVLRALNSIWRLGLSLSELAKIALTIDSDVPYCIYNKLFFTVLQIYSLPLNFKRYTFNISDQYSPSCSSILALILPQWYTYSFLMFFNIFLHRFCLKNINRFNQ